jgi:hypothetical protein
MSTAGSRFRVALAADIDQKQAHEKLYDGIGYHVFEARPDALYQKNKS